MRISKQVMNILEKVMVEFMFEPSTNIVINKIKVFISLNTDIPKDFIFIKIYRYNLIIGFCTSQFKFQEFAIG